MLFSYYLGAKFYALLGLHAADRPYSNSPIRGIFPKEDKAIHYKMTF